ncbi:MAG: hypothetical protein ACI9PX_000202 [Reinekea sp.]|jgi:hypothetical protein
MIFCTQINGVFLNNAICFCMGDFVFGVRKIFLMFKQGFISKLILYIYMFIVICCYLLVTRISGVMSKKVLKNNRLRQ